MSDIDNFQVQKSASMQDIINDHMAGVSGYAIAEKYGLDTEKVKQLIDEADKAGKFIPDGGKIPVDSDVSRIEPLVEGHNPSTEVETTKKK